MKKIAILLIVIAAAIKLQAQLYQGPAQGTTPAGFIGNTNTFTEAAIGSPTEKRIMNKESYREPDAQLPQMAGAPAVSRIYVEDESVKNNKDTTLTPLILRTFNGLAETNSIPPDPYIAVGPNHIIITVNTNWAIYDKKGTLIKSIDATNWYKPGLAAVAPFDPKVIYDHFNKRWVMVWLDQDNNTTRSNLLISVSDDSDPTGVWYNWIVPAGPNGSTSAAVWSDYQGVGYDKDAIYITSNQWTFGSTNSFMYAKIRIIPSAQLYANTAGTFTFNDIWDIRNPVISSENIFMIRPARTYTSNGEYYLAHLRNANNQNAVYIYKIVNATTTPTMTATYVPITAYSVAPNPNQLGGGSPLLEGGGSTLRNEPVYMNDRLYLTHTIRNPNYSNYSSVHYLCVNTKNSSLVEDYAFGANEYYFFYSALAVDTSSNVVVTYSRSGDSAYAGAYFATKYANTNTFTPSYTMQAGRANYVKTYSGTRNRWGDYNGLWLDPANSMSCWAYTEYVAASNTWGTWVTEIRSAPFPKPRVYPFVTSISYKPAKVGTNGDTTEVVFANYGVSKLILDSIKTRTPHFKVITPLSYPLSMNRYDTLKIKVAFAPTAEGAFSDTLKFYGNDPEYSGLPVTAKGYLIIPATEKKLYAMSRSGQLNSLNTTTGTGTLIGASNYLTVLSLAINPKTKVMYGLRTNESSQGEIIWFNTTTGEAFTRKVIPGTNYVSIAFDTAGTLYAAMRTGAIYKIDLETGARTYVDSCKAQLSSIAFNPFTNQLWGTIYKTIGTGKDILFKINMVTGDTTIVGNIGSDVVINSIVFDEKGMLYASKGAATAVTDLIKIDTATGHGTLIGSTGITGVTALGYFGSSIVGVKEQNAQLPSDFVLHQNYPNPFNPSTIIAYSIPVSANVELSVYNVLGEKVAQLEKGFKNAGNYTVSFNINREQGLSSGVYFYELTAAYSGGIFKDIKKLNIVK